MVFTFQLDGRFSLAELLDFAELCDSRRKMYPSYEFVVCCSLSRYLSFKKSVFFNQSQMQGFCMFLMWQFMTLHGTQRVEEWYFSVVLFVSCACLSLFNLAQMMFDICDIFWFFFSSLF